MPIYNLLHISSVLIALCAARQREVQLKGRHWYNFWLSTFLQTEQAGVFQWFCQIWQKLLSSREAMNPRTSFMCNSKASGRWVELLLSSNMARCVYNLDTSLLKCYADILILSRHTRTSDGCLTVQKQETQASVWIHLVLHQQLECSPLWSMKPIWKREALVLMQGWKQMSTTLLMTIKHLFPRRMACSRSSCIGWQQKMNEFQNFWAP